MILVKTYLAPSPIHGIGLFADEDIPEGTKIWEWTDLIDQRFLGEEVKKLPKLSQDFMRTYAWEDEYGIFWLCLDNTRFANHSETPTCKSWFNGALWMDVALRDIKKGEEITYNYRDFHKGDSL